MRGVFLALLAAAVCVGGQPEAAEANPASEVLLSGQVTGADNQTWRMVPFEVPPGTTRITVEFDYTTRDERTTIDLGLLGPDGFRGEDGLRGWSGGNKRTFTIAATDATPSYLSGPLRPGTWNLLLGIPNIRRETRAEYTARVKFERSDPAAEIPSGPVLRSSPGWYRGDLHMHTAHSDGTCLSQRQQRVPCPVFLTVQTASERGLDFIAITDHNTTSQADAIRELQPYFDNILLIPGRELTTFHGHANLFGTVAPVDFREGTPDVPDWNTLLANVARTSGVLSINHPVRPSGEVCMGCGWTARGELDYGHVQAVEVVNGADADTPFSGIPFWEHLLDRGYRLTALGGSDNHDAKLQNNSGAIGTPTTVIYADELSQAGLLAAIRRGRVFIDVAGTRDRSLDMKAHAASGSAQMGDTLRVRRGTRIRFEATVNNVAGGELRVILDGQRVALLRSSYIRSRSQSFEFTWRADDKRHWIRVDVADRDAHLALIGNPIYVSAEVPAK
jgi:hypothetical protein